MRRALIVGLLAIWALATACGSDASEQSSGPTGMQDSSGHGDMGQETDLGMSAFGEPGKPADAGRTIEVAQLDSLRFAPESIEVDEGETVTFRVTNEGAMPHEFVIGDMDYQRAHEDEMMGMGGDMMSDSDPGVYVEPGETAEFTWTFTESGAAEFACHVEGHYAGGMRGDLTVSS